MDLQKLLDDFSNSINTLLAQNGTDSNNTMLLLLGIMAFLVCGLALLVLLRSKIQKPIQDPNMQLVAGLRGKLEKLEQSINELQTERKRQAEFNQLEFEYVKNELSQLSDKIKANSKSVLTSDQQIETDSAERNEGQLSAKLFNNFPKIDAENNLESSNTSGAPTLVGKHVATPPKTEFVLESTESSALMSSQKKNELTSNASEAKAETSLAIGLKKTRQGFFSKIKELFVGSKSLTAEQLDEFEALLISSDLGPKTTSNLISNLNQKIKSGEVIGEENLLKNLKSQVEIIISEGAEISQIIPEKQVDGPLVVLVVGVNGTGKTTSVAKLSQSWKEQGKNVLMVAADTFRAAAVEQLKTWGTRLDIPVISGAENAKPGTVVFSAMQEATNGNYDVVIIDTAGRLHNKSNLMQELEGIKNSIQKHQASAPHEVLLVLDGTSGQNALQQAKEFNELLDLTGLIITKLDGTAKGGIVVAIKQELGIPVRYIGIGEGYKDLKPFNSVDFTDALFSTEVASSIT